MFNLLKLICVSFALLNLVNGKEAKGFEELKGCVLEKDQFTNDGDSFKIRIGGDKNKLMVIRLYGVDCMETNAKEDYMQARLKEQGLYFGVHQKDGIENKFKETLKLGEKATRFVKDKLQKPFTVKTKYVNAMGKQYRVYGYIITSDGEDLGELLVRKGLARIYGRVDPLPEEEIPYEYRNKLEISEILAIRDSKAHAWKKTNWDAFKTERAEYRKLISKLNINSMEDNEFNAELIAYRTDVSKTIAKAVLAELKNGPYKDGKDLDKRVKGVGAKTAKKLGKVLVFE